MIKRTVILLLSFFLVLSQAEMLGKSGGAKAGGARVGGSKVGGAKVGGARVGGSKVSGKIGGGSKGVRSFSKNSTPRSTGKYVGRSFQKPRTIQTSTFARRQVSFTYTRPVRFYNPYLTYYLLASQSHRGGHYNDSTGIAADTNAFPGFGMGRSGGAGASTGFTDSLTSEHGKDTLEVTELKPINFLSDYAMIVSDKNEPVINSVIRRYRTGTGVEIAVLTIPTLGEEIDLEEYAQVLFDKWGVGEKGVDNGILIIISSEDEVLRVQPGYGMEELLTDAACRDIEDKVMVPHCKEGQWEQAVSGAVAEIIRELGNKPVELMKQELAARKERERQEMIAEIWTFLEVVAIIAGVALAIFVFTRLRRR
jgi:uncharacterized membrane protein YgcG